MQQVKQCRRADSRNSSIELLKIFAIVLIVVSHVVQTLHTKNTLVPDNDYIVDLSMATTNIPQLVLVLLRHSGIVGNSIFFFCSAWFLLEQDHASKKKILQMLADVWVISLMILIGVLILRRGKINIILLLKQLLPTTQENNWYVTCYLLFYPLHPYLNRLIKNMEQKALLKTALALLFLYVFANYIFPGRFFASKIILWVTLYFATAYMKFYLVACSCHLKTNLLLIGIGIAGHTVMVLLTNFLGLHFELVSTALLMWNNDCNPFLLLVAVSLFNIARNLRTESKIINYISGLSLLIYLFHENALLRTYYRPMMWDEIYHRFGYHYILVWTFLLVVIVFAFGLAASILYKHTIQRAVAAVCSKLYPALRKIYRKTEQKLLKYR